MSDFWILVRTNFRIFIGSLNKKKKGRYAASGALMAVMLLFVGVMMAFQSAMQAFAMIQEGVPEFAIFMSLVSSLTIGILFGLMRAANAPTSSDAELLLSLPVRRVTVVLSKVVTQYIFDSPLMILFFVPSAVTYSLIGGGDAGSLARGIILALLLPFLPIALTYLLGSAMAKLQEKYKMTGMITTALLMLLVVGYMFLSFQSTSLLTRVSEAGREESLAVIEKIAPLSWLTHFVLDGGFLPVVLSILMLAVPFAIGVWFFASSFGKPRNRYRSNNKNLEYKVLSPKRSLLEKEVHRYLACSIYVFNTAFGPLLMIVFAVAMAVIGPEKMLSSMEIPTEVQGAIPVALIRVVVTGILCFITAVTSTTASSISLEGRQLWILKAHPVRTGDIFWAKSMLNIILVVPVAVVSALMIGIRMGMPFLHILGLIAALALLSFLISFLGLIANLLFPRFDWDSETSVVKQSMSVMISMLFDFAAAAIPFILYFTLLRGTGYAGFCLTAIAVYGVLAGACYLFLRTKGEKMFEEL